MQSQNTTYLIEPNQTTEDPDIKAIQEFLGNKAAMQKQLAKLEEGLRLAAGDKFDPQTVNLHGYERGKHFKQHRLFTNYLREWAIQNGFAQVIKIMKFLAPSDFYSILASRSLFFDIGLAEDRTHGEMTHILQIYCVTEHAKENPGFISKTVPEIIEAMGREGIAGSRKAYWGRTFEISDDYNYGVSSHCKYLLSESCFNEFPVLATLILTRHIKETFYKYTR